MYGRVQRKGSSLRSVTLLKPLSLEPLHLSSLIFDLLQIFDLRSPFHHGLIETTPSMEKETIDCLQKLSVENNSTVRIFLGTVKFKREILPKFDLQTQSYGPTVFSICEVWYFMKRDEN